MWLQIKADVLNRQIVTVAAGEATCLGVAMLAAVGCGVYASLDDAAKQMVRIGKRYQPSPAAAEIYQEVYGNYLNLNKTLLPTFGGKL